MMDIAAGRAHVVAGLGYLDARDVVLDPRGRTVRCTPRRRTVMHGGGVEAPAIFRKLRCDGGAAARREWHWLQRLPTLGFSAAAPVCLARAGRASAVVSLAVPGRPLAALLREAGEDAAVRYVTVVVAPMVARLHGLGLVFRDLYWNHLFAASLDAGSEPAFIDVERILAPVWRWRRWVVKDLAGLVASWPEPVDREAVCTALVSAYVAAAGEAERRRLGAAAPFRAAVATKAARILARRPRYGT